MFFFFFRQFFLDYQVTPLHFVCVFLEHYIDDQYFFASLVFLLRSQYFLIYQYILPNSEFSKLFPRFSFSNANQVLHSTPKKMVSEPIRLLKRTHLFSEKKARSQTPPVTRAAARTQTEPGVCVASCSKIHYCLLFIY